MSSTFNHDWEQAVEAKFAHDEEHRFLVAARRDKLFAAWAAARIHLPEAEGAALVKAVLAVLNGKDHDRSLLRLVGETLAEHGAPAGEAEMAAALTKCAQEATRQLDAAPYSLSGSLVPPKI